MVNEHARKAVSEKPMSVLFISRECHVQNYIEQPEYAYWYESAFAFYGGNRVRVGIAYEEDDQESSSSSCASPPSDLGITYYPLKTNLHLGAIGSEWETARSVLLDVVNRFEPDIIQCFGSEWPCAAIVEDVDVPVVVHMMGFLNIYYPAIAMAKGGPSEMPLWRTLPKRRLIGGRKVYKVREHLERVAAFERRVMSANRFFMGRTEWDKNIVKYYSPGARYFEVPEPLRLPFIQNAGCWRYHFSGKLQLLTVASVDERKGLEIILWAAKLLKELVGIDFEWRIAGNKEGFDLFEERCGIYHNDVNIRLLGMLEAEDVVSELVNADLFINSSIIDNSIRTLCEAQIIGCPAISSNVGGVPQFVDQGVTGFLYPYNEPHTLAFLIANLAEQREVLTSVSETASCVARKRHDPQVMVDRMLDVYKEVIATYEK